MRRYGVTEAEPDGKPENTKCCAVEIPVLKGHKFRQCELPRGFGPYGGVLCGRHARMWERGEKINIPEDK